MGFLQRDKKENEQWERNKESEKGIKRHDKDRKGLKDLGKQSELLNHLTQALLLKNEKLGAVKTSSLTELLFEPLDSLQNTFPRSLCVNTD